MGHDERPVYYHKTGERLAPHSVKAGRESKGEAMIRHQLIVRTCADRAGSRQAGQMSMGGRVEEESRPFMRSRLVSMEVVPRHPIRHIRRHSTSQMHQDHHLESCVDQEQERTTHSCASLVRHQRCVLARAANSRRATCDVPAAW